MSRHTHNFDCLELLLETIEALRHKGEIKVMADIVVDVRISVAPAAQPLAVDAKGVPATATVGQPYSGTLVASGGTPPYKLSLQSGALPDGISLDQNALTLSGTPTVAGDFDAILDVSDSAAVAQSVRVRVGS